MKKTNIILLIIICVVVIGLIFAGIFLFASQNNGAGSSECGALPDKLDTCEPFSCEFEHPFTGEMMEKRIIGLVDGECQYTEEMPNNGRMDCEYPESLRRAVAQYYRDIADAESFGVSVNAELVPEGSDYNGSLETIYTIDGKEVENPLMEALINGQCVISGYGTPIPAQSAQPFETNPTTN